MPSAVVGDERLGIILRILSGLSFAFMTALVKVLAEVIPLGQIVFFRSLFALIPLAMFLALRGDFPSGLKTENPIGHIVRCLAGTAAMFCAFGALRYIPIAEATTIQYLSPVIIVVLAVFVLREQIRVRRWIGVAFGLAGVLVMTLPNFQVGANSRALFGIGLGFIGAFATSVALLQVRRLSKMGEHPGAITFYFAMTSSVIGAVALVFGWQTPTLWQLACLIGLGFLGGCAQILMTVSFRYAEASALAPFEYLNVLWAIVIGMLFFDELPTTVFLLAAALIVVGAVVATPYKARYRTVR